MVKDRKKLVKAVSTLIIVCVVIAAIIGLLLLFNMIEGSTLIGNIMLTLLTVFISGLFFLNSVNAIVKGNKLGIAAAIAIMICAVLYILLIWIGDTITEAFTLYPHFVVILSMASIFLNLVISNYITLGKSLLGLQVALYISFGYIETAAAFAILGNPVLIEVWQIFVAAIIVSLALYVVLKVKQKNIAQAESQNKLGENGEFVTITKEEYERLKAAEEKLKAMENAEG